MRHLLENLPDAEVRVFDKLTYAGSKANLSTCDWGRTQFVQGDVCDRTAVQQAMLNVDTVIHLAAESSVDRSLTNVEETWRTNYIGTHTVLSAAHYNHRPVRLIHVSTDEVYGPAENRDFHEGDFLNTNPQNPYAISKLASDLIAQRWPYVVVARPCNNYGPYQYPDKLIPLLTYKALCDEPLPVYGDGKQRRDWLHVDDHCRALLALLTSKPAYWSGVYNIPGGNERENIEVACIILDELGKPESLIEYVPDRPGHDIRYGTTGSRIASLGWKPEIDWEEGLRETVRWYAEHKSWLARRMA